jgi:hypothetical protein
MATFIVFTVFMAATRWLQRHVSARIGQELEDRPNGTSLGREPLWGGIMRRSFSWVVVPATLIVIVALQAFG